MFNISAAIYQYFPIKNQGLLKKQQKNTHGIIQS